MLRVICQALYMHYYIHNLGYLEVSRTYLLNARSDCMFRNVRNYYEYSRREFGSSTVNV